jgi:glycerol-3-phosphate O-acyltransferase
VRQALDSLCRHGVVRSYTGGTEPVWSIGPERHLEAAFYRNSVVHTMVNRAIAELVLVHIGENPTLDPVAEGWNEALRIRDVLKFEFFFARKREWEHEFRRELALIDPDWESLAALEGAAWDALERQPFHFAPRVLSSFLEAYLVVAERLTAREPREPVVEKDFLAECIGVAHQYRLQLRLRSTESISRELFATALKLAANRHLVDPGREDLRIGRQRFEDEIRTLVDRIARIRVLALSPRSA